MKDMLTMSRPASCWGGQWREALPIGNGFIGALVYGRAMHEKILVNHTFAWREGYQPEIPDVSDVLPEMRRLIDEGRVPEADRMLVNALEARGYAPKEAFPVPLTDILIETPTRKGFREFTRSLDMAGAQALTRYRDGDARIARRAFVSRADDVIVVEQTGADAQVRLAMHRPDAVDGSRIKLPKEIQCREDGEWRYYAQSVDARPMGAVARVVRQGDKLTVLCKVFPEGEVEAQWERLKREIEALPADYDALFARHLPLHRALFERCRFELEDERFDGGETNEALLDAAYEGECPNALARKMWAFGRYLLICATAPGGLPCALLGLWCGEYAAGWAFNMANINLEEIYWQAYAGKLPELILPVFDYYEGMMDGMRENARKLYGARGIYLTAVSMPGNGRMTCMAPHIVNWTGGAGWVAQMYFDYWRFTRDEAFLRERAYPFMKETALFYEDFLCWTGDTWRVIPSVSPENNACDYRGQGKLPDGMQTAVNATMDIAIVRELMTNLLAVADDCGATQAEKDTWRRILDGSPAYQANGRGGIREWNHPDFPDEERHRHLSHVYPLFPGLEHARGELREAFHKNVKLRLTDGISYTTSWALMLAGCSFARAGDAQGALDCLDWCSRAMLMGNFFTAHNDWRGMGIGLNENWAPFQIDADIGWSAVAQEMLLYSDERSVECFPALPKRWRKGAMGPLATRCGVEVSLRWDETRKTASVRALRDAEIIFDGSPLSLKAGETVEREC